MPGLPRRWLLFALLAGGCAGHNVCDFVTVEMEQPVQVTLFSTTQLHLSIGDLPPDIQQPSLLILGTGDSRGLSYWVRQPNGMPGRACGAGRRNVDQPCSHLMPVEANTMDSFWVDSDASGEYELELSLIDLKDKSSLREAPVCTRFLRIDVVSF